MSILPRGVESTERGIAYLKEHTAKLDAELAGHMAALNFAEERYIRETARHQAKCDYRIAQSSAAHAAGTLDTLYFGADGEARHRLVPTANTTTTRPDPRPLFTTGRPRGMTTQTRRHADKGLSMSQLFACDRCGEARKSASTVNKDHEGIPHPKLRCSQCKVTSTLWTLIPSTHHRERLEMVPIVGHMAKVGCEKFSGKLQKFCERE